MHSIHISALMLRAAREVLVNEAPWPDSGNGHSLLGVVGRMASGKSCEGFAS